MSLRSPSRRVVVKARVVRHQGARFRSAPLARHLAYLRREGVEREDIVRDGVTRGRNSPHDDGRAPLFDTSSENADGKAFAERCEDDRHHFRFIVSPEDAPQRWRTFAPSRAS